MRDSADGDTNRETSRGSKTEMRGERPTGGTDGGERAARARGSGGVTSQGLPGTLASLPQPSLAAGDRLATPYRTLPKNGGGGGS